LAGIFRFVWVSFSAVRRRTAKNHDNGLAKSTANS
jgi:hypothetical protein